MMKATAFANARAELAKLPADCDLATRVRVAILLHALLAGDGLLLFLEWMTATGLPDPDNGLALALWDVARCANLRARAPGMDLETVAPDLMPTLAQLAPGLPALRQLDILLEQMLESVRRIAQARAAASHEAQGVIEQARQRASGSA